MEYVRVAAGFPKSGGNYHLPRACLEPPESLQLQIFPEVEYWLGRHEKHRKSKGKCGIKDGGVAQTDYAGVYFLQMLQTLRVTLLQDMAIVQPDYPDLPGFNQAPFNTQEWLDWSAMLRAGAANTSELVPRSILLEQSLPEISHSLTAHTSAIVTLNQANHAESQSRQTASHLELLAAFRAQQAELTMMNKNMRRMMTGMANMAAAVADPLALADASSPSANPSYSSPPSPPPVSNEVEMRLLMPAPPPLTTPTTASSVEYIMRNHRTVADLWQEWTVGMCGEPSIEARELEHGCKWRPHQAAMFCRRKKIIDAVRSKISGTATAVEAVAMVEEQRGCMSLYGFAGKLGKGR